MPAKKKQVLLIVTASIAAYKVLDLVRLLRDKKIDVVPVMTNGAKEFITPLSLASLAESQVYQDVFSLKDEMEMGHIRLSRESDLVVVAPATADIIGKMANGLADDLASTVLLATDKPVLVAPAMNMRMYEHAAVQRNIETLKADSISFVGPKSGKLACGEEGWGRMAAVEDIVAAIEVVI